MFLIYDMRRMGLGGFCKIPDHQGRPSHFCKTARDIRHVVLMHARDLSENGAESAFYQFHYIRVQRNSERIGNGFAFGSHDMNHRCRDIFVE